MSLHSEQKINFQDRETPSHTELSSRRVYWGVHFRVKTWGRLGVPLLWRVWTLGRDLCMKHRVSLCPPLSGWQEWQYVLLMSVLLRRFPWANADSQWLHEDWRFECRHHDPPKPTLVAFPSFLDFSPVLSSPWRAQWRAGRGRSCWASSWWLARRITSTNSSACSPKWSVS